MIENTETSVAPHEPTELQILNGGIEIQVVKIDGATETVSVRQLPIALIGEWGRNQGSENEAYLVELLCDKVDRATEFYLRNAQMTELRLLQLLQQAPFAQIEPIEKRLQGLRTEIATLTAKPRWSDNVTHESIAEIRDLGHRLNKKKFVAQMKRTSKDAEDLITTMTLSPLAGSALPRSLSPSQQSAESQSGT